METNTLNADHHTAVTIPTVTRLTAALGAEISGIDLNQPLDDATFKFVHDALVEHQVIFFRNQDWLPEMHKQFALRFGPVQIHPAFNNVEGYPEICILENSEAKPSKIEMWHTDMTFSATPPLGSILHSKHIPPIGGDTLFSSMSAAYEALSDKMQSFLSGLTAVHDFRYGFKESLAEPGGPERLAGAIAANPPVAHPVIRTHPISGKKGIFVNSLFTTHIVGMKAKESEALLNFLYQHVILPEFICRFKWQVNSVAFWDNRITQHKPVNDFGLQYRVLQRITVDGDKPY